MVYRLHWLLLVSLTSALALPADEPADDAGARTAIAKAALARFNPLIGEWRGVGQPKRNSNRGAWQETSHWVWDLSQPEPAVVCNFEGNSRWKQLRFIYEIDTEQFVLHATNPDDSKVVLRGNWSEEKLVVETDAVSDMPTLRLTLTPRGDNRATLLLESAAAGTSGFARLWEVGCTRAGTRLAAADGTGPECVVTGGLGTIPVTHAGQTYYVCCTGCQQAFEADPEGVLAEYRKRLDEAAASP
jgi:hypothetical protein